jgi:hypothetical protein
MSNTYTLIDQLSADGAAPPAGAAARFAAPLAGAAALCALVVALLLDGAFASTATEGFSPIIVKWGFSLALVMLSAFALWAIGKPGRRTGGMIYAMSVPFVLVAALLALDLLMGNSAFPGATWKTCLAAMAVMSPIAFAGAVLATRWLAPVKLRRAGLAAGLFGGAVAMTCYAPFCPEHGMLYMAVFYCLPILTMAALGWLLGPRLLRW